MEELRQEDEGEKDERNWEKKQEKTWQINNTGSMPKRQSMGEGDAIKQGGREGDSRKLGETGKEQEGNPEGSSRSFVDMSGRISSHLKMRI